MGKIFFKLAEVSDMPIELVAIVIVVVLLFKVITIYDHFKNRLKDRQENDKCQEIKKQ